MNDLRFISWLSQVAHEEKSAMMQMLRCRGSYRHLAKRKTKTVALQIANLTFVAPPFPESSKLHRCAFIGEATVAVNVNTAWPTCIHYLPVLNGRIHALIVRAT